MPVLTGDLLNARQKHVMTIALDKVHDVVHAFFRCDACGRECVSINVLTGNVHGAMNDLRACAKLLLDTPERLIPDTESNTCTCAAKSPLRLERAVLCRTNPRRANDFHLRVRYGDVETDPDNVFAASLLFPDGRYVAIPFEQLLPAILPA